MESGVAPTTPTLYTLLITARSASDGRTITRTANTKSKWEKAPWRGERPKKFNLVAIVRPHCALGINARSGLRRYPHLSVHPVVLKGVRTGTGWLGDHAGSWMPGSN